MPGRPLRIVAQSHSCCSSQRLARSLLLSIRNASMTPSRSESRVLLHKAEHLIKTHMHMNCYLVLFWFSGVIGVSLIHCPLSTIHSVLVAATCGMVAVRRLWMCLDCCINRLQLSVAYLCCPRTCAPPSLFPSSACSVPPPSLFSLSPLLHPDSVLSFKRMLHLQSSVRRHFVSSAFAQGLCLVNRMFDNGYSV